jgi:NADH dehydrogenase [ubiquinone] 1 alpha subcomplex assembly factor 1
MKTSVITAILLLSMHMSAQEVYDFSHRSKSGDWFVVDDGVMGGRSQGNVELSEEGHGIFQGTVSLENNGGFSSIRTSMEERDTKNYTSFKIRLKGDGKNYQFRVRSRLNERHSYQYEFPTTGEWQEVTVPFDQMIPTFRGMRLNMPNYPGEVLSECSFLISNKKNERFRLEIDKIWLDGAGAGNAHVKKPTTGRS